MESVSGSATDQKMASGPNGDLGNALPDICSNAATGRASGSLFRDLRIPARSAPDPGFVRVAHHPTTRGRLYRKPAAESFGAGQK